MITIYDIAKKAEVSAATVSKVFNDYHEVSRKTKDKVLKVADELGYVPNLTARSLKTNKSYLVGVIFSEDVGIGLEHQFFSSILEAFRRRIGKLGYDTVFISKNLGNREIGYLEHAKYRNVDGVFIITALADDVTVNRLLASHIPCVTTDIKYTKTAQVASDNYQAAKDAVKYLYDMGHRKIAHISGPLDVLAAMERREGFFDGLRQVGLEPHESYVIETGAFSYDAAYKATGYLLSRFDEASRPTAMFVDADVMAVAAMKAIRSKGLKVPGNISVIGFDDVEFAKYVTPELTTVSQNKELIGSTLANVLYEQMNQDMSHKEVTRIATEIVQRASVRRIDNNQSDLV